MSSSGARWSSHGEALSGLILVFLLLICRCQPVVASEIPVLQKNATSDSTPVYGYKIVNTFPHDPDAFTQGLIFSDGFLFESTGLHGRSSLRKVELETGIVLRNQPLSNRYFAEGLTAWKDRLIQLTWTTRIGFVYNRETFLRVGEFRYSTEGWGLTNDGENLIMSDGSSILRFLDPETFQEKRKIQVKDRSTPVWFLNELEWINGEIYANIWQKDVVARISPQTGQILGWVDLSGLRALLGREGSPEVLNGIAHDLDRDRIFVTGKLWPKLFEIKIVPKS
jgi:glutaminyl-peptide cyclotransferase